MKKTLFLIFFFLFLENVYPLYSYRNDLIKQLNFYKSDIVTFENWITQNNSLINFYKDKIDSLNTEITILSEILEKLETSRLESPDRIIIEEAALIKQQGKYDRLKDEFARKLVWLYKNGKDIDLQILFTSKSFNEITVKLEYLIKVTESRKRTLDNLRKEKTLLEEKKKISSMNKNAIREYIKTKKDVKNKLLFNKSSYEKMVDSLATANEVIKRQIDKKNTFINEIQQELSDIKTDFVYNLYTTPTYGTKKFPELKGQLIFPVESINIINPYGVFTNTETATLENNYGIDVSIARKSNVRVVYDGTIEAIIRVPYFGLTVIVRHDSLYRTVYSSLSEVNVSTGQTVKAGYLIAKTGDNPMGQAFHYEIWEGKRNLNPTNWVKKLF
ncbi:MAG: murein hydrolase activator EnvC family protein [Ignavibacteria bacterium]